ncbi:MAG TPA: hypothetical protein VH207_01925 [Chthoniobacterales bacterium]|nr:hypothetical protein [Chthoniobacterales bacterium]
MAAIWVSLAAAFVTGSLHALPPRNHPDEEPHHMGTISFFGDHSADVLQGDSFTVPAGTLHASVDANIEGTIISYEFSGVPSWISRSNRTLKVSATAPPGHSATVEVSAIARTEGAVVAKGGAAYVITVLGNWHPKVTQFRPTIHSIDMSIAVSDHHILAGDYNNFDLYSRNPRTQLSLDGTELASNTTTSDLAIEHGAVANLMRKRWTGTGEHNVNIGRFPSSTDAEVKAGKAIPCDPANPAPSDGTGNDVLRDANGFPTSACIDDFYDTRTTYDKKRKRFWIVTHGRDRLWATTDCKPNAALCKAEHNEATRITFAAVSKSEDPTKGFHTFKICEDYEDFPLMAIHGQYAVFHHNVLDGEGVRPVGKIWLFDAEQMAAGKRTEIKPVLTKEDFPSAYVRVAKHHGTLDDLTFFAAASGSQLWVFGLPKPSGTTHGALIKSKTPYSDPGNTNIGLSEVVYRNGNIYVAGDEGEKIRVWRVPISLSGDKKQIILDLQNARKWTLAGAHSRDYVSLDVNKDEDVVISFRAYDAKTPTRIRYAVLYHGESSFRESVELSSPSGGSSGDRIDLVTSEVDPSDDETIWFISRDADGPLIASVRPR